jgi:hypothetical protein
VSGRADHSQYHNEGTGRVLVIQGRYRYCENTLPGPVPNISTGTAPNCFQSQTVPGAGSFLCTAIGTDLRYLFLRLRNVKLDTGNDFIFFSRNGAVLIIFGFPEIPV